MSVAGPRIASVRPIAVTLDLDREPMSFFFVRVETDDGLVGLRRELATATDARTPGADDRRRRRASHRC